MEFTGDSVLAAPRDVVWRALTDPAVLARCIDGVADLSATTDAAGTTRLAGTWTAPVESMPATAAIGATLVEVEAPGRLVLAGNGAAAGTRAEVTLTDCASGTHLRYAVSSSAGSGAARFEPPADAAGRSQAEGVLARLKAAVETADGAAASVAATEPPLPVAERTVAIPDDAQALHGSRARTGLTPLVWCVTIILVVLAVLAWQLR